MVFLFSLLAATTILARLIALIFDEQKQKASHFSKKPWSGSCLDISQALKIKLWDDCKVK